MACNSVETILKECLRNSGGIYNFYYTDQSNIASTSVNAATYIISGITFSPTGTTLKYIEFSRNTGNYTETDTNDLVNGSSYTEQTINLMLHRRQASISRSLKILGEGQRYLAIIIKDANGLYWYFPYMQLSATGEGSGTAKADGSKYSVTFVGQSEQLAYEVSAATVAAII